MESFALKKKYFTPFRIIVFGFTGIILLGTLLLMLPIASCEKGSASFADALFTSTSAVCVTGLVVRDTATYWTLFGQSVILVLIQIGGLGVVTVAVAVTILSGKKIGLIQRSTLQEAIAAPQMGGIVKFTNFILRLVLGFELAGAAAMSPVFCREFGLAKGIWYSLFHSVSAFCNAGFDLMGVRGQFSSLTSKASNPVINITVMLLIIFGGLGFVTWSDIKTHGIHFRKYKMQSKVILVSVCILILFPALFFFIFEYSDLGIKDRVFYSLFQSVTTRTAGFNTADLTLLSGSAQLIFIMLMLIGGSPGSTAGGMKTTTVAVLFSSAFSVFRRKDSAHFFGRRIPSDAVRTAISVFIMYLTLFISGAVIISVTESLPISTCLFETASAIGTVGLTLGITPGLGLISRTVLVILMFLGRVGGLTIIFAAQSQHNANVSQLPQEKITVG